MRAMTSQARRKILVTGATGNQGGAVLRTLQAKGHTVRALTRRADAAPAIRLREQGAELASASLDDRAALDGALEGIDAVFGVTTSFEAGEDAEVRQGKNLVDAVAASGAYLVFSSVAWAWAKTGIPHFESKWQIEEHIRSLGLPNTIIGPSYFMENAIAPWSLPALRQQSVVAVPLSDDIPQASIAVQNIADLAVYAFEHQEEMAGQRIDIAGDILTGPEMAAAISEAAGAQFPYYEVPKDVVATDDLRAMFNWYQSNRPTVDIGSLKKKYPEIRWTTWREWAAKQNWPDILHPKVTGE